MAKNNINEEKKEIIGNIEIAIKKLVILLDNSTIPDDIKNAWILLLPNMSIKQIDRLLKILEAKYLDEQTSEIDDKYKEVLKRIVDDADRRNLSEYEKSERQINEIIKAYG